MKKSVFRPLAAWAVFAQITSLGFANNAAAQDANLLATTSIGTESSINDVDARKISHQIRDRILQAQINPKNFRSWINSLTIRHDTNFDDQGAFTVSPQQRQAYIIAIQKDQLDALKEIPNKTELQERAILRMERVLLDEIASFSTESTEDVTTKPVTLEDYQIIRDLNSNIGDKAISLFSQNESGDRFKDFTAQEMAALSDLGKYIPEIKFYIGKNGDTYKNEIRLVFKINLIEKFKSGELEVGIVADYIELTVPLNELPLVAKNLSESNARISHIDHESKIEFNKNGEKIDHFVELYPLMRGSGSIINTIVEIENEIKEAAKKSNSTDDKSPYSAEVDLSLRSNDEASEESNSASAVSDQRK